jgi:hypothetical protein
VVVAEAANKMQQLYASLCQTKQISALRETVKLRTSLCAACLSVMALWVKGQGMHL